MTVTTNYIVKTTHDAREEFIRITPEGNGQFLIRLKPERQSRLTFTASYDTLIALQYVLSQPDVASLSTAVRNALNDRTSEFINIISSVLINETPGEVYLPKEIDENISNEIGGFSYGTPEHVDF